MRTIVAILISCFLSLSITGCSKYFWGGAAVGAAGAGAAYEYQNKKQMDKLEEDYQKGNISKEEYERRKKEIESGSIIY